MKIVWLETDSLSVPLIRPEAPHNWTEYPFTTADQVAERIANAEILIVNKVKIGPAQLEAAPNLRGICLTATGKDNIDLQACEAAGVEVRNVVNYGPEAVAEHAFASLMQLVRRIPEWEGLVHDGSWSKSRFFCLHDLPMRSMNELSIGILGSGAIGSKLADYCRAFGMKVVQLDRPGVAEPRPGYAAFEATLPQLDVLSLHCPLNEQTKGLIGDSVLGQMKNGSILLNTARGGLVQFGPLRKALESGQLYGAALDVLDVEPPPVDHPMLAWRHPRLIITPHVAWGTKQAQTKVAQLTLNNIESFLKSKA